MDNRLGATAFAKINIGLRIGPRSSDSYHPIISLFQSVSLSDHIALRWSEGGDKSGAPREDGDGKEGEVVVDGDFDCPPEATTLYKAAVVFLRGLGIRARLRIDVDKGIPAKAGLGGGSADAAALLVLLNQAFKTGLGPGEIAELGLSVGSDVPFFFSGGTALVHGRGELIETLPPSREFGILLIQPSFGVATPWAYGALDSYRAARRGYADLCQWDARTIEAKKREIVEELKKPLSDWGFVNDFAPLLYREYPAYRELDLLLRSAGAAFVSISGSGSSIYGLFENPGEALEAKARLLEDVALEDAAEGGTGKLLYGMGLHAIKPLETSLRLG